jgi:Fe-S-cluster-containing dehydrogenase component
MPKAFLIDLSRCNGCYNCQIVCKDEHCDNDWRPYAAPQPETGQFWMRIDEKVRGQVPVVRVAYTPILCAHCEDAPCVKTCSADAFKRRPDGLLILEPATCTGCGNCVDACPQRSIFMNTDLGIAQKCTGCAHLLDNGWDVPRCVDACAHDAIQFKDESEFGALLSKAEILETVSGFGSKAYYLNLPKRFIAGCVVDFAIDEALIDVTVELQGTSGFVATQETDEFGDFKFDQIPADVYTVAIRAKGYAPLTIDADATTIDLFVGDLSMKKD